MITKSVPLPPELVAFIQAMVDNHEAENEAQAIRLVLKKAQEESLIKEIAAARASVKEHGTLEGDLDELTKDL